MGRQVSLLGINVAIKWVLFLMALLLSATLLFPVLLEASAEKEAAIAEAEAAIDEISDPFKKEDMITIRIARHLVSVAIDLGAVEGDIDNIAFLLAAEEAITNLFREDYMRHSILELPAPRMGDYNALAFVRNKEARWWNDDRAVNGIRFLPMGSLSSDYGGLDEPEGRWVRYDISGRGYTLMKGYVGIDDFSTRQDYPVVFQILADGNPVPIYEVEVDYGEYPAYYLLDIEGLDELVFRWAAADGTDDGNTNQFVIVEPQFFIPINQDMLTAIDSAEVAIDALPAEISNEDESVIKAARAAVEAAYSLGVDQVEGRIGNLDKLLAAEEILEELFYENYIMESLNLLGDPGTINRNSAWLISYDDQERWNTYEQSGTRGSANLRTFAPVKVFTTTWQNLHQTARYAEWDISKQGYAYLEGYIGVSDISGQPGHPYNFTIYGDGEPLFEALLEYGREPEFYRVKLEAIEKLKIEFSALAENVTENGWTAWPVYVEPHFLLNYDAAILETEEAIARIPRPVAKEDMLLVRIARHLVERVLNGGAKEQDISNLAELLAAEEEIETLYRDNYMRHSILDLPTPSPENNMGHPIFTQNRRLRWWECHRINKMCFLPLGSVSVSYITIGAPQYPEGRWAEYDISGKGFKYVKGYAGINDNSIRHEYPTKFRIHADGVLVYEETLEYGEYPKFYFIDIEGVDNIRFGWFAEVTDVSRPGETRANETVAVEPQFFIPINQEMLDAIEAAEAAIDQLPEHVSFLDESEVKNARAMVQEAFDFGVEKKGRIRNLDKLITAEKEIYNHYLHYYEIGSLLSLGNPGEGNYNWAWFVDFYNPELWYIHTKLEDPGFVNFRSFEPLKAFSTGRSNLHITPHFAQWDLSDKDYIYIQGFAGISDITNNEGLPLDFVIFGDDQPLFEAHLEYGRDAKFYRLNIEDVTWLKIQWSAENVNPSNFAAWPVIVEPLFLCSPQTEYALSLAEETISALPDIAEITLEDWEAVQVARAKVNNAVAIGVAPTEISNLADLEDAEAKLADLIELPDLIAAAIAAIDALPDLEAITNEDRPDAVNARSLVDQALDKGAQKADITNISHLEAVEAILDDIWDLVYGDVNGDGVVNVEDVILVMQQVLGIVHLNKSQILAADVNGDDLINVEDVILIIQKVLGLIQQFPVED